MSLPESWVERIFARLLVRYGAMWLRMWEGVPMEAVAADWSRELSGLSGDALSHALENLPADRPPTVAQFKALACSRVPPAPPVLPAPKADPQRVASIVSGMRISRQNDPMAWAHALRDREQRGDRLTIAQRDMWRAALRVGPSQGGSA